MRPVLVILISVFLPVAVIAQDYYNMAIAKFDIADYENAAILLKKNLHDHPGHQESKEYLGDIFAHQGSWDEAISIYKELSERVPNNAGYHYKFGGAMGMKAAENRWFALMNYKEIRFQFEEALRLNPKHIDSHWALVEYYLQLPGILGGGEEKAKDYAHRLIKISKVDGYLATGRIAEFYKKFSEAEKAYIRANKIGQSVHTFRTLAKFYKKNGRNEKADVVVREAEKIFGVDFLSF